MRQLNLHRKCGTRTSKRLGLICGHGPKVLQIAFVTDEHNDDVRICVVTQLLEPPCDVDIRRVLGDVVHQQCSYCTAVVSVKFVFWVQRMRV